VAAGAGRQPEGRPGFGQDEAGGGGQGGSYSYSIADGDEFDVTSSNDNNTLRLSVQGANGDQWGLTLAGHPGQALAPGEYTFVDWVDYHGYYGAGLSLSTNGRWCSAQSGSFTIENIAFGPYGDIHVLDATFVQRCQGSEAALRGEVHFVTPDPLELDATIAPEGIASQLDGSATVHGTISCTQPVTVDTTVFVTQVVKRVLTGGHSHLQLACTPEQPTTWTANVDPYGTVPFQKGDTEVTMTATATDPVYNVQVNIQRAGPVQLEKSPTHMSAV